MRQEAAEEEHLKPAVMGFGTEFGLRGIHGLATSSKIDQRAAKGGTVEFGQSPAPLMVAAAAEALSQANKSSPDPAVQAAVVPVPWMETQLPVRMAWVAVVAVLAVTTVAAMVALASSSSVTPRAQ